MRLVDIIRGNMAELLCVRDGHLHYEVIFNDHDDGHKVKKFAFKVPFEDVTAQFNHWEKASAMMRWIRLQLENNVKDEIQMKIDDEERNKKLEEEAFDDDLAWDGIGR